MDKVAGFLLFFGWWFSGWAAFVYVSRRINPSGGTSLADILAGAFCGALGPGWLLFLPHDSRNRKTRWLTRRLF